MEWFVVHVNDTLTSVTHVHRTFNEGEANERAKIESIERNKKFLALSAAEYKKILCKMIGIAEDRVPL